MDLHLKDKVFIVSGGAKGIGRAICELLAEEGAKPVILDMDRNAGTDLARTIKSHFIGLDLNNIDACEKVINEVTDKHGKIDGLVNNAGRNDGVGLAAGSPDAFIHSLQSNVGHFYFLTHFSLRHLKDTKG